ncbi:sulfate transporter CysZ, partial [Escherichia coli]|uniref:sulfate transporter CysZ n=1 Tax=Escherichia coli TaxID=562 RepID=UPI0021087ACD
MHRHVAWAFNHHLYVSQPGIRRFVILPLLVNILLMGGAFWWLFTQLDVWIPTLMSYVPDWLQWLSYLLWPLAVISVLLVLGYFFSTIANWIAAPFNGLLAEQLEARLTGATPPDTGIFGIMKDIRVPYLKSSTGEEMTGHDTEI